ncbi:MAG: tetratricopeptide repeat protein [Chitinivibrionales bacterium]|nr:tetratricopeptide repeat protein [Chitinivibrionales bacterium]
MATIQYRQFKALLHARSFSAAARFAESQSVAHNDTNAFWLNQHAIALNRQGEFAASLERTEKALRLDPDNAYILLARADAFAGNKQFKQALDLYREIIRNRQVGQRARYGILSCLSQQHRWTDLDACLAQWNLPPRQALPWQVKSAAGKNRSDAAHELCKKWLAQEPDNPRALWELTRLEVSTEGIEPVRKRFGRLSKIPGKPHIYQEIYAWLCKRDGIVDAAVKQYEKLTQQDNDPRLIKKQAFALAKSGRESEAIGLMEELMRIDPKDYFIERSYIAACRRIAQLERGWNFFHELRSLFPDDNSLWGKIKRIQKELEKTDSRQSS